MGVLPNIDPTDLWGAAVAKINGAIDAIFTSVARAGKTITFSLSDGSTIQVDNQAAPNSIINEAVISQNGIDQRKFTISAGNVVIDNNDISVAGNTVTLGNGDPTNPRIDALIVDNLGVLGFVAGTPNANPVGPTAPANTVLVGYVYVEPGATDVLKNIYLRPLYNNLENGTYFKESGESVIFNGGALQPEPPDKASQLEVDTGTNNDKFVTPLTYAGSTTKTASQAETDAGTNDTKYVTPLKLANFTGFPVLNYSESFTSLALTINSAWHTVTVPGAPANSVIQIVMENNNTPSRFLGCREVGSILDRRLNVETNTSLTMITKTNGAGEIQVYSENRATTEHYYTGALNL